MEAFICKTCGCQYPITEKPPTNCKICDDERQYVGWDGQQWLTMGDMQRSGYRNEIRDHEANLTGVATEPRFGIGQRACIVRTSEGNFMFDPITYLDEQTYERIRAIGGIQGIGASHPHFYGAMVEWSHAFDNAPIYIPDDDKQWVTRPDPVVTLFRGAVSVLPGVTLIQCGGHFPGSAVVHWQPGADDRGVLLTGDSINVVQDRRSVSFLWSYPNIIPLSPSEVQGVVDSVEPYRYDRIYGGWWGAIVDSGAKDAVRRSAERYIRHVRGE